MSISHLPNLTGVVLTVLSRGRKYEYCSECYQNQQEHHVLEPSPETPGCA